MHAYHVNQGITSQTLLHAQLVLPFHNAPNAAKLLTPAHNAIPAII
jgi:hypothetical protein